jgi:Flp pilus assembly pilin Flp
VTSEFVSNQESSVDEMTGVKAMNSEDSRVRLEQRAARRRRLERGLTTVEYVVVLVLIAVIAIPVWKLLGQRVSRSVQDVTHQFDVVNAAAAASNGAGASTASPVTGAAGPEAAAASAPGATPSPTAATAASAGNGASAAAGTTTHPGSTNSTAPPVFTSRGSGTQQVRTTEVGGTRFQINTGHAFDREHRGPGGKVTDLRTTGLSPDQIESAIIADANGYRAGGRRFANPGPGFSGPTERTVVVDGHSITYRAVETAPGHVGIGTYYLR